MRGIELLEAVAYRDIGADDEDCLGIAAVRPRRELVEDAPGGEHGHDRRLAGAGGHLAGIAKEGRVALCLPVITGLVEVNIDAL